MNLTSGDIPMGLGMALAQNLDAMSYFTSLSPEQQQSIIEATHNIHSKQEMRSFVESLANQDI